MNHYKRIVYGSIALAIILSPFYIGWLAYAAMAPSSRGFIDFLLGVVIFVGTPLLIMLGSTFIAFKIHRYQFVKNKYLARLFFLGIVFLEWTFLFFVVNVSIDIINFMTYNFFEDHLFYKDLSLIFVKDSDFIIKISYFLFIFYIASYILGMFIEYIFNKFKKH